MNDETGGVSTMKVSNGGALTLLVGAAALAYIVRDHLKTPYDALFDSVGKTRGVPPNLLRALARTESSFRPGARNPKVGTYPNGSYDTGLMQLNTKTAAGLGLTPEQLADPAKSIDAAAQVLVQHRRSIGVSRFSPYTWAASYNVGPDLLPWDIGAAYASRVLYHWQLYDFGRMFA